MIDAEQLRAARALLDWKTSDLAEKTGLTVNAINKIERGSAQGRRETMEKIQKVFEDAGLEFLPDSGLRKKNRIVTAYEGGNANRLLVEDLYNTLSDSGGEILIAHLDEGESIKNLDLGWLAEQIRLRKEAGITHRLLVRPDDPNLIPPLDSYRCIPGKFFSPYPLYIYGPKLALVSWEPSPRVVVVEDARFADSARKLFNFVWMHADPVAPRKA
ncbi:MAG: helix-turn-helix transcriptional regulator [Alphaproteobacteria bacterium]|nr:helix-turn-helix transcriptional regulator [Alphaproteobacteria bacterium]